MKFILVVFSALIIFSNAGSAQSEEWTSACAERNGRADMMCRPGETIADSFKITGRTMLCCVKKTAAKSKEQECLAIGGRADMMCRVGEMTANSWQVTGRTMLCCVTKAAKGEDSEENCFYGRYDYKNLKKVPETPVVKTIKKSNREYMYCEQWVQCGSDGMAFVPNKERAGEASCAAIEVQAKCPTCSVSYVCPSAKNCVDADRPWFLPERQTQQGNGSRSGEGSQ
jgi:hypothetical protein